MKRRAAPTCASSAENSVAAQKKLALAETERRIRVLLSGRIPPGPIPRELIYSLNASNARQGIKTVQKKEGFGHGMSKGFAFSPQDKPTSR